MLRLLLALDPDVVILQELCKASRTFLAAVLPSHTLIGHFLLRTTPTTRAVWLEPLAAEERCAVVDRSLPETTDAYPTHRSTSTSTPPSCRLSRDPSLRSTTGRRDHIK